MKDYFICAICRYSNEDEKARRLLGDIPHIKRTCVINLLRSLIDRGKSLEDWKELLCSCGVPARTLDTLSFFAYLESDHQDEAKEIYGVSKRRTVCVCLSGRIVK